MATAAAHPFGDREFFLKLARARMPYGKHEGMLLVRLPEPYVVWMVRNAMPTGELGRMIGVVHEIKVNGLEYLFEADVFARDPG
jgi:uncharacterized protein (DUF3820 family)